MENLILKLSNQDIEKELHAINFDESYISVAKNKYKGCSYKLFGLKPHEANILKQLCLSLGFDCAVDKNTVTCKCEYTNAIIFASIAQLKKLSKKLKIQPFRLKKVSKLIEELLSDTIEPMVLSDRIFDWKKPYIMGIVNVTPDSFSDGGLYFNIEKAYKHVNELIEQGADIIDIGGESTRPNAIPVPTEEEIKRTIPLIEKIRKNNIKIPISIDTRNYATAKAAIEAGANIINDVSMLNDNNLLNYVNELNLPIIIMHSNKVPAISNDFTINDPIEEIYFSLHEKIKMIRHKNSIIDVGIGFGKSENTNFELLKRTEEFKTLKRPVLAGISRKSFMQNAFNLSCEETDIPTALYTAILALKGVNIHRVHNVKLAKEFLTYSNLLL